jgi:hypothetical protein
MQRSAWGRVSACVTLSKALTPCGFRKIRQETFPAHSMRHSTRQAQTTVALRAGRVTRPRALTARRGHVVQLCLPQNGEAFWRCALKMQGIGPRGRFEKSLRPGGHTEKTRKACAKKRASTYDSI